MASSSYPVFKDCKNLKEVTIGNEVELIPACAFYNCSGLTSITIPNSVTYIADYAFHSCSGLTNITIGSSVTAIGNYAFSRCSSLTNIIIPNSVTSIGKSAFQDCNALNDVTCLATTPPFNYSSFSTYGTLHVLPGCKAAYTAMYWKFLIVEDAEEFETGIEEGQFQFEPNGKADCMADDGAFYDLQGCKVKNARNGLYIQNGRVVLMK